MKKPILAIVLVLTFTAFGHAISEPHWTTAITQTPASAEVGTSVTFSATLMNVSGRLLNCRVVGGIVGGPVLYDNTFGRIVVDTTETISFTWTVAAGEYTFYLQIDPDETTDDTNRSNNRIELTRRYGAVSVSGPINFYFTSSPGLDRRTDLIEGEAINIGYSLSCDGAGCDDGVDIQVGFKVNGTIIDTQTRHFPESARLIFRDGFVWNAVCGANIELILDPNGIFSETNEGDNRAVGTIGCRRPNLRIFSAGFDPTPLADGETVTFRYKIKNSSDPSVMSGPFHVALKRGDRVLRRNNHESLGYISNILMYPEGTFTWTVRCGEPLSIVVDSDNEVVESDESDNIHLFDECYPSRLNLGIGLLQMNNGLDNKIEAGREARFTVVVKAYNNNPRNVLVKCGVVGGPTFIEETITELEFPEISNAFRAEMLQFSHQFCPVNRIWEIYCIVDPDNVHSETDETDNRKVIAIRTKASTSARYSCEGIDTTSGNSPTPSPLIIPPSAPGSEKQKFDLGLKFKQRSISAYFSNGKRIIINGLVGLHGASKAMPIVITGKIVEIIKGKKMKVLSKLPSKKVKVQPKKMAEFIWNWYPKKAGNYKIIAQFKPLNPKGDSNKSNNSAQLPIELKTKLQLNKVKGKK